MATASPKKGTDNRTLIKTAAFRLFHECGYRLTSYSKIAEASGLGRPLVQYYFPKKEDLATEYVLSILKETSTFVSSNPNALAYLTQIGQVYYAFLLADDDMRRLTQDLLSSRQVTSRVTMANAEYTIPAFADTQSDAEALRQASIQATGGIYEMLFIGLEQGQDFNPASLSAKNTAVFAAIALGRDYKQTLEELQNAYLPSDKIASICNTLNRRIFS